MAKVAHYRQADIRLAADELTVGRDVYALDDVLYAEVVDARGRVVTGLLRREDVGYLFWIALTTTAAIGLVILMLGFGLLEISTTLKGSNKFNVIVTVFLLWLMGRGLINRIRSAYKRCADAPLTLRIHARVGSMDVLQTRSLIVGHILVARISRAAKRRMLS